MKYLKISLILICFAFLAQGSLYVTLPFQMSTNNTSVYEQDKEIDFDPTPKELQWVDKFDTIYVEDGVIYKL